MVCFRYIIVNVGRDSSVSTTTLYGLDVPGMESQWGEVSRTRPDLPWGPPSLLYNRYRVFPRGNQPGRGVDRLPPTSAEAK